MKKEFKKCCAEQIRELIVFCGHPMNIVRLVDTCSSCGHFIGITQTPIEEMNKFLKKFGLEPFKIAMEKDGNVVIFEVRNDKHYNRLKYKYEQQGYKVIKETDLKDSIINC